MKIFNEFKKFISKGNVIDLAVGMIIGAAFTAIVTAIVTNIFTPLINLIPISDTGLQTVLREAVTDSNGNIITAALIIDWGAVISAVITFFITALILFFIVKGINTIREGGSKMKKRGKKNAAADEAAPEPEPAAPPAPTTEELLAQIIELLKANKTEATLEKAEAAADTTITG